MQPVKQKHYTKYSYGYLFEANNKKVFYSGDTSEIKKQILDLILADKLDYVFFDSAKSKNPYHISIQELSQAIPPKHRKNVYCMHLHDQFSPHDVHQYGFKSVEELHNQDHQSQM